MESLHYLLMRAHMQLNRIVLSQAAELGLTSGQPKVLEFLHMAGGKRPEIHRRLL